MHANVLSRLTKQAILSGLVAVAATMVPAHADVLVIGSNAASLKPGTVVSNTTTLDVPSGARVRLMLPSGRTQEFKGPVKVNVSDLGKGEAVNESLWRDVKRLVANRKEPSESVIGAVRSVAPKSTTTKRYYRRAPAAATPPLAFSWRRVPIDVAGDVCVEKGAPLELLRREPGRPLAVTVVNMQVKKRAGTEFAVGAATADWPATLASDVGRYVIVMPDGVQREIRIRPIAPLPNADETLRVLHSQRCLTQVASWLQGQMTASR